MHYAPVQSQRAHSFRPSFLAQGVLSRDTLAVGMARLGQPTQQVNTALLACGEFCCPFAGMVKMLFAAQALWFKLA
jgi:hypothetical protein